MPDSQFLQALSQRRGSLGANRFDGAVATMALMDIAVNEVGARVSRSGISERQHIPLPYLTQVLRTLVNGGLLRSTEKRR